MPSPARASSTPTLLFAVAIALVGCHQCGHGDDVGWDSDLVGGACEHDGHCVDDCVEGGRFPDGTCTVACDFEGDCPEYTRCVDVEGGICLLSCDRDDDCRGGYDCEDVRRRGSGGHALVCID